MKKHTKLIALVILVTGIIFTSCKKDDTNRNNNTNNTAASFSWQENGAAAVVADSAYWTTGSWGTGIRAFKGGMANFFEINWGTQNNTAVGTKTLDPSFGITFIKAGTNYVGTTGQTINLTAFAADVMSGNFILPVRSSGGTTISVSATFTAIPKR